MVSCIMEPFIKGKYWNKLLEQVLCTAVLLNIQSLSQNLLFCFRQAGLGWWLAAVVAHHNALASCCAAAVQWLR